MTARAGRSWVSCTIPVTSVLWCWAGGPQYAAGAYALTVVGAATVGAATVGAATVGAATGPQGLKEMTKVPERSDTRSRL